MKRRKLERQTAHAERIRAKWRPHVIRRMIYQTLARERPVFFIEKILGKQMEPWQRLAARAFFGNSAKARPPAAAGFSITRTISVAGGTEWLPNTKK